MDSVGFEITYRGGEADRNSLDMRLLGRSMIGFERIGSDGIILASQGRAPRRKERAPVTIVATAPLAGSLQIPGLLQSAQWMLPFAWDMYSGRAGEILWRWTSFVLHLHGGRKPDAEVHAAAMQELVETFLAQADRADSRTHETMRRFNDNMTDVARRLIPAAQNFVAPVGPACDEVSIGHGIHGSSIDIPMADAIRSKGDVEVSDLEDLVVAVDGFEHHNKTLKIGRLDGPGYMSAIITDPAFDVIPNIYTQAAERQARLAVQAKRTTRDGRIEKVHISNALGILAD